MTRLRKDDAELLMEAVDTPLLQAAVALALRCVLDVDAFADDWPALIRLAGELDHWSEHRSWALLVADDAALADLATELNERRTLGRSATGGSGEAGRASK